MLSARADKIAKLISAHPQIFINILLKSKRAAPPENARADHINAIAGEPIKIYLWPSLNPLGL
jgi:hypothetical protein